MNIYYHASLLSGANEFAKVFAIGSLEGGSFFTSPIELYNLPRSYNGVFLAFSIAPEHEQAISELMERTKNIAGDNTFSASSDLKPSHICDINYYEGYYYIDEDELLFKPCDKLLRDRFIADAQSSALKNQMDEASNRHDFYCSML